MQVTFGAGDLSDIATIVQITANVFTIVGVGIALFAGWVGYATLISTASASRQTHMHTLFREYLKMRADPPSSRTRAEEVSFKLYALEEMYYWIRDERELASKLNFLRPTEHTRRTKIINAWEATVEWHLTKHEPLLGQQSLYDFKDCYGEEFRSWAHRHLAAELKALPAKAAASDKAKAKTESKVVQKRPSRTIKGRVPKPLSTRGT